MKLTEEILVSNYTKFKKRLVAYIGDELALELINLVGGDDKIMRASFATTADSGLAYEGSLCRTILMLATYAIKINEMLPEEKQVDKVELVKVCLLSHISKVVMFEPNTNEWEISKRGIIYTFSEVEAALRMGERSIFLCMQAGIKLSECEYEAMRILDKSFADDNYSKYYSNMLSVIIRQSNEIIDAIYNQRD